MKITVSQLRGIIKEEIAGARTRKLTEATNPIDHMEAVKLWRAARGKTPGMPALSNSVWYKLEMIYVDDRPGPAAVHYLIRSMEELYGPIADEIKMLLPSVIRKDLGW